MAYTDFRSSIPLRSARTPTCAKFLTGGLVTLLLSACGSNMDLQSDCVESLDCAGVDTDVDGATDTDTTGDGAIDDITGDGVTGDDAAVDDADQQDGATDTAGDDVIDQGGTHFVGMDDEPADGDVDEETEDCAPAITAAVMEETVEIPGDPILPKVLLLVDRSRSMTTNVSDMDQSRWDVINDILFNADSGVLEPLAPNVEFGLTHYTSDGARRRGEQMDFGACVAMSVAPGDIQFGADRFQALSEQALSTEIGWGTPTGESLQLVADAFAQVESQGEKHIIVVTDGQPDHCNDETDGTELAESLVLDAARTAHDDYGITVHVIGIGDTVSEDHLRDMAEAGGGLYYTALTRDAIEEGFEGVLAAIPGPVTSEVTEQRSCELSVEFGAGGNQSDFEAEGLVTLDGRALILDDSDGWTFNTDGKLELLGSACDDFRDTDSPLEIGVAMACEEQPISLR